MSDQSIRALHVIPSLSLADGGPTTALRLIVRALDLVGVEVTVATTSEKSRTGQMSEALEFRRNTSFYKYSWSLGRWLVKNTGRFDVVHIHALFSYSSIAAARAAKRAKVPYIVRPLGVLNKWGMENRRRFVKQWSLKIVELPILRGAAAIHYTAEAERREAASAHPEIASLPSAIIPIPVRSDDPPGDKGPFQARFPGISGRRLILFLSRLDPKKGIELLLSAFEIIRPEFPDALLVIAGDGEKNYTEKLRQKARELGCAADILWTGFVTGPDKAALLATASVFVLPSFSENFGIAAAEALAAGIPSILSEHVAISGDAEIAQAAVVVACEAIPIAEALRRLLNDAPLCKTLSERGRRLIKERFSEEAVGAELVELYRRVVREGKPSCAI